MTPPEPAPRHFTYTIVPRVLAGRLHIFALVILGLYTILGPLTGIITVRDEHAAQSYVQLAAAIAAGLGVGINARTRTAVRQGRSDTDAMRAKVDDLHRLLVTGETSTPPPPGPPS